MHQEEPREEKGRVISLISPLYLSHIPSCFNNVSSWKTRSKYMTLTLISSAKQVFAHWESDYSES